MKYEVSGTLKFSFVTVVEADSEDEAEDTVADMDYGELVESTGIPDFEIDDVQRVLPAPKKKKPKRA